MSHFPGPNVLGLRHADGYRWLGAKWKPGHQQSPWWLNCECSVTWIKYGTCMSHYRADSRLVPSQWETALLCNDVSHWLGAKLESALYYNYAINLVRGRSAARWFLYHGWVQHLVVIMLHGGALWSWYQDGRTLPYFAGSIIYPIPSDLSRCDGLTRWYHKIVAIMLRIQDNVQATFNIIT